MKSQARKKHACCWFLVTIPFLALATSAQALTVSWNTSNSFRWPDSLNNPATITAYNGSSSVSATWSFVNYPQDWALNFSGSLPVNYGSTLRIRGLPVSSDVTFYMRASHNSYGSATFAVTQKASVPDSISIEGPSSINCGSSGGFYGKAAFSGVSGTYNFRMTWKIYDGSTLLKTTTDKADCAIDSDLSVAHAGKTLRVVATCQGKTATKNVTIGNGYRLTLYGPTSLSAGDTANYSALGRATSSSPARSVSPVWSIQSGAQYARIDAETGVLTTQEMIGDAMVVIQADWGGLTQTRTVTIKGLAIEEFEIGGIDQDGGEYTVGSFSSQTLRCKGYARGRTVSSTLDGTWGVIEGGAWCSIDQVSGTLVTVPTDTRRRVVIEFRYIHVEVRIIRIVVWILPRVPVSIAINGPSELDAGKTGQYTAITHFSDGTTAYAPVDWECWGCASDTQSGCAAVSLHAPLVTSDSWLYQRASRDGIVSPTFAVRIRAKRVQELRIVGPSYLQSGGRGSYHCIRLFVDGTSDDVTESAAWSVVSGGSYASFVGKGVLQAASLTTDRTVRIQASLNGNSAVMSVTILAKEIQGLFIEGPDEVVAGNGAQYRCRVYYADGTSTIVSPNWTLRTPVGGDSISQSGWLSTLNGGPDRWDHVCADYRGFQAIKGVHVLFADPDEEEEPHFLVIDADDLSMPWRGHNQFRAKACFRTATGHVWRDVTIGTTFVEDSFYRPYADVDTTGAIEAHNFTDAEQQVYVTGYYRGLKATGVVFVLPKPPDRRNVSDQALVSVPIYRFYSKTFKGHFFTIDEEEKDNLINNDPNWRYEGIAYYAFGARAKGMVPLYRFYSKNYHGHFFTIDENEKDTIIRTNPDWKYEGVACYVYPVATEGTVPVHRFWNPTSRHHFFTTDEDEKNGLLTTNPNWEYEGAAFWALKGEIVAPAALSIDELRIFGLSSVPADGGAFFSCSAIYADGSTEKVSPVWSIVSGSTRSTIDANGGFLADAADAGRSVTIRASWLGMSADFVIDIVESSDPAPSPPAGWNDDFANAYKISGTSGSTSGTNEGATLQNGEPTPSAQGYVGASVWWKWTAPSTGSFHFSTAGSAFDTVLAIFTGSALSALSEVASDDDGDVGTMSRCSFEATAGTTYRIMVAGYSAASGSICLSWSDSSVSRSLQDATDNYTLEFETGGDANWSWQATESSDGVDAARSGPIPDYGETWMQATGASGPGIVSFRWKVSSESNYDWVAFYVDGEYKIGRSGTDAGWRKEAFKVGDGTHTFEWRYWKDGSLNSGSDCAWVDQVVWTSGPAGSALSPVYRFFSPVFRGHFFTMDEAEMFNLVENDPNWRYEGVAYFACPRKTTETTSLYRFYSQKFRGHFYTRDYDEYLDILQNNPDWSFEKIAFHVRSSAGNGASPVYRFWSNRYRHHFYTADYSEYWNLRQNNPDWAFENIAFYAWIDPDNFRDLYYESELSFAEEADGAGRRALRLSDASRSIVPTKDTNVSEQPSSVSILPASAPEGGSVWRLSVRAGCGAPDREGENEFVGISIPGMTDVVDALVETRTDPPDEDALSAAAIATTAERAAMLRLSLPAGVWSAQVWSAADGTVAAEASKTVFDFDLPVSGVWHWLRVRDADGEETFSVWLRAE